jgi:gamma-glutamyl hydrolase
MWKFLFIIAFCYFANAKVLVQSTDDLLDAVTINDEPMIGVLSQEISYYLDGKYPGQFNSYIAASYVKFVEGGGARVVPIW